MRRVRKAGSSVLSNFRLPGCTAPCVWGIWSFRSCPLLHLEKQPLITATSAFIERYTTGNVKAISLSILQQCFSSAVSLIIGNTLMRQDICSSPLHYHHLDLLFLPYVPCWCYSHPLQCHHWLAWSWCPWCLASLTRDGEGGTRDLKAGPDLTVVSLDFE